MSLNKASCMLGCLLAIFFEMSVPASSFGALKEGDSLPNLSTFELEGKLPEKLKGRVILLDFWASWCAPCKSSFPAMEDLHKRYADRGLTIVAVSVDHKREGMEEFLKKTKVTFVSMWDAKQKFVAAADISAMPTSMLIDRAGKIRFLHHGFRNEETVKKYNEEIEILLKEPGPK